MPHVSYANRAFLLSAPGFFILPDQSHNEVRIIIPEGKGYITQSLTYHNMLHRQEYGTFSLGKMERQFAIVAHITLANKYEGIEVRSGMLVSISNGRYCKTRVPRKGDDFEEDVLTFFAGLASAAENRRTSTHATAADAYLILRDACKGYAEEPGLPADCKRIAQRIARNVTEALALIRSGNHVPPKYALAGIMREADFLTGRCDEYRREYSPAARPEVAREGAD